MNTFGQVPLGIIVLCLLAMLVIVKQVSTGSILGDKPKGGFLIWVVNVFNLFFLLVANPLAGVLLVIRRMDSIDPTRITIETPWILDTFEILCFSKRKDIGVYIQVFMQGVS